MKKIIYILQFIIISCAGNTKKKGEIIHGINPTQTYSIEEQIADSVSIPDFSIKIELSEKAKTKIKADKESIVIKAKFFDLQVYSTEGEFTEFEEIGIKYYEVELWNSDIATFKDMKISKEIYDSLSDPNFKVVINAFSGRHKTNSNLLTSKAINKTINDIKGKQHLIKVKLISE